MEGSTKPLVYPYFCKEDFMKKTLAILLALVAVGGFAFAQGKVVVGIDGITTLIDQTYDSTTAYCNNTSVNGLAFSAVDAANVKGASISFNESFNLNALTVANYKGYWNFFDNKAKVSIGNFSMSDYRGSSLYQGKNNGKLGGGQIEQVMLQAYPVAGLSIGVQLPYAQASKPVETILKTSAFGVSYAIDKVGSARAFVNLGIPTDTTTVGASFEYTGTDKLDVLAWYKNVITSSMDNSADISATYSIDKLSLSAEGLMDYATALTYTVWGKAAYAVNDNIAPYAVVSYDSAKGIDVCGSVPYDFLNGVTLEGNLGYGADGLYWSVPLYFSVSF